MHLIELLLLVSSKIMRRWIQDIATVIEPFFRSINEHLLSLLEYKKYIGQLSSKLMTID